MGGVGVLGFLDLAATLDDVEALHNERELRFLI
jgi:hypothetical protein